MPTFHLNIENLGAALNVLTAMITPALLLSACGTFILSTSNRLARIVDRIRALSHHVETLSAPDVAVELRDDRIEQERAEIKLQSRRLRLIQHALTLLYFAAVSFLITSVAIGLVASVSLALYWIPVAFGIFGAILMLAAAIILASEARKAVNDLAIEADFHRRVTRHYAELKRES